MAKVGARCRLVLLLAVFLVSPACTSLPEKVTVASSRTLRDTENTMLAQLAAPAVASHPRQSGFHLLASGETAFVARMALMEKAERSLDVQYYIWHADSTGSLLAVRMLQAADRGVRVRLLLDDLDTSGKDRAIMFLDAHPNIEIRLYNPFAHRKFRALDFATDLRRVNRRMHNKSITADNSASIVGGRNVGNEYFGAVSESEFADLDILGIGPIVAKVSEMFDLYWNSELAVPLQDVYGQERLSGAELEEARSRFAQAVTQAEAGPYMEALRESDVVKSMRYQDMVFYWGEARLLYDQPIKTTVASPDPRASMAPVLSEYVDRAQREILLVSAYFVPSKRLVDKLGEKVQEGVRVQVLTNSLAATDVALVHAGYIRHRRALLEKGVELYEFKSLKQAGQRDRKSWTGSSKASLHAKTIILDQHGVFVGSFNVDPRSTSLNTEVGVILDSAELGQSMSENIREHLLERAYQVTLVPDGNSRKKFQWETLKDGQPVRYDTEPDTTWWQRVLTRLESLIVPEGML